MYKYIPGTTNPSYGIYIQTTNGVYLTANEWDDSYGLTPNGVAVITEKCSFVIALEKAYQSILYWTKKTFLVTDIVTTTEKNVAMNDYDGIGNTEKIIEQDTSIYTTSANKCKDFAFPNGKNGYLGSAGEWQAVLDNYNQIELAMLQTGGDSISDFYWTSTQASETSAWRARQGSWGLQLYNKTNEINVRAFAPIK